MLLPCTDGLVLDQCYIPSYPMCTKVFVNSVSSWLTFYKYEKHSRKICQCHGCLCSFGHFDQKAKSCVCNVHIHNITFKYTIQLINLTMIMTSQMSNQNFVCKWKFTNHQMCNLVYDILDKKCHLRENVVEQSDTDGEASQSFSSLPLFTHDIDSNHARHLHIFAVRAFHD